jgi:tetratricopeptide (TPR) repeat protein
MSFEPADLQRVSAAEGFVQLGMYLEADAELDKIDPFCRASPKVLAVRLGIYAGLRKWELMQMVAKKLTEYDPQNVQWTLSWAYATRRAESIKAAKSILIEAFKSHPEEALISYNLACYDCQLGDLGSAKQHLKRAFKLKPQLRLTGLADPDLEPLWTSSQR